MDTKKLDILQAVYFDCIQDRDEEKQIIQNNLSRIQEINTFLFSMDDKSDFDFFSPRNEESVSREKMEGFQKEKLRLEDDNSFHYNKVCRLDRQIGQLQLLIDNFNIDKDNFFDIVDIQEKERCRIANDIHDSTVQNLTHLVHAIELSSMYIDKDIISAKLELESCRMKLQSVINEMRDIIFDLRPMSFDDLGFKECIENFVSNLKLQFRNFDIKYDICDLEEDDFNIKSGRAFNLVLLTIYRIIREAVINALKHSNADYIFLKTAKENGKCIICIEDNGKGFKNNNKENNHFGIVIMEERINLLNGSLLIETEPECGTKIKVEIPLKYGEVKL
ncbi:hypothetical protein D3Z60_09990 [Lachnospiraceae bacterium]|jgi:two-component system sensor histidine kinase DegS|nr:hypothetical protein [Lachnospiraceae bacterium]